MDHLHFPRLHISMNRIWRYRTAMCDICGFVQCLGLFVVQAPGKQAKVVFCKVIGQALVSSHNLPVATIAADESQCRMAYSQRYFCVA